MRCTGFASMAKTTLSVALSILVALAAQWALVECQPGAWESSFRAQSSQPLDLHKNDLYNPSTQAFTQNFGDAGNSFKADTYSGQPLDLHNDLYNPDAFSQSFASSSFSDARFDSIADNTVANPQPFGSVYTYDATRSGGGLPVSDSLAESTRFSGNDETYDDATTLADSLTAASSDDESSSSDNSTSLAASGNFQQFGSSGGSDTNTTDDPTVSLAAAWGGCASVNPVDDCWRCDANWAAHRQNLADCAIGFGRNAVGGKNGRIYVVTSPRDDNVQNPAPGTLRHAVTRAEPLWIIFAYSMNIFLKNELIMASYKTIDGRGVEVHIAGGAGITLQYVNNVIIHGIHVHDIKPTGPARIMSSVSHVGDRGVADGDAISLFTAKNIWIDHCSLANAADGLIDVIRGSTAVTISNNYFSNHDKVMLLGAHPNDLVDRSMQVTIAYNTFGPGLVQRLPRVRLGTAHIVNNDYSAGWGIYAIGGSEDPTILSQGNYFDPGHGPKQVTKRINDGGSTYGGLTMWNWKSVGDIFLSGSFFTNSGSTSLAATAYSKAYSCSPRPASLVLKMTQGAGALGCKRGARC